MAPCLPLEAEVVEPSCPAEYRSEAGPQVR